MAASVLPVFAPGDGICTMTIRVWCETVSYDVLRSEETVALLVRHGVAPIIAVRPGQEAALPEVLARHWDAGLSPSVWPMLSDEAGRWGSSWNLGPYSEWTLRVAGMVRAPTGLGAEVALDLEPPIALVAGALSARPVQGDSTGNHDASAVPRWRWLDRERSERSAAAALRYLLDTLHAQGFAVMAAVAPCVVFDPLPSSVAAALAPAGWQRALGTPVDGLPWDHVSVMAYTSMLAGWSRGALDRTAALALFRSICRHTAQRFGPRASVSVGAVGTGALGDEPVCASARELAEDVAVARACGIDDLALFDLGGVLDRPPAEAWFEAMGASVASSPFSLRAAVVSTACSGLSLVAAAFAATQLRVQSPGGR